MDVADSKLEINFLISVWPRMLVEDMVLRIDQGPEVSALDWDSQYLKVSDHKMEKHFEVPLEVQPGEHSIVVFAKADGKEWPQSSARSVQLPRYSAE